jgi:O-antigen/teichoic acid export membrane protein
MGLNILISYSFTIYTVRLLGASESGLFFLGISILSILSVLATFGFEQSTLKIFGNYFVKNMWGTLAYNLRKIEKFIIAFSIFITLLSLVFFHYFSIHLFYKQNLNSVLYYFLISIIPVAFVRIYGGVLNSIRKHVQASLTTATLIPLFTIIYLFTFNLFKQNSLLSFAFFYFLSTLTVFIISKIIFELELKEHKPYKSEKIDFRGQIKYSLSMQIIILLSTISTSLPAIILGIIIEDTSSIAYFVTANKIALLYAIPLGAINNIIAPRIASLYKEKKIQFLSLFIKSINSVFIVLAILITILIVIFSELFMGVFGSEFVDAKSVLNILLIGQFINLCTGPVGFMLSMTSNHRVLLKILLWNSFLFIIIDFILTYFWGIDGLAIGVSLSICSLNIACVVGVKKNLNIFVLPNYQAIGQYYQVLSNFLKTRNTI